MHDVQTSAMVPAQWLQLATAACLHRSTSYVRRDVQQEPASAVTHSDDNTNLKPSKQSNMLRESCIQPNHCGQAMHEWNGNDIRKMQLPRSYKYVNWIVLDSFSTKKVSHNSIHEKSLFIHDTDCRRTEPRTATHPGLITTDCS